MRRVLPVVATGLAALALVLAIVTFTTHHDASATAPTPVTPAPPPDPQIVDQHVAATDLVSFVDFDTASDPSAISKALGLAAGDRITAIQGRDMHDKWALTAAMSTLTMSYATVIYIEVERNGKPLLVRDHIDGDLGELAMEKMRAKYPDPGPPPPPPPATVAPDPSLVGIAQIDDAHVEVPKKVREAVNADPSLWNGARVLASMKNGQPNGLKLYAIRPSAIYAQLGFQNGDTVQTINGTGLTSWDQVTGAMAKPTQLVFEITRRGRPFELTITVK